MNTVQLIGRLTTDVEAKRINTKAGKEFVVADFRLAVRRNEEETDFISCKAYGKLAEFMEDHCAKGLRIGVVGSIRTGSYEGKMGNTVYTTDVIVDNLYFADGKREEEKPQNLPEEKKPSKYKRR